MTKLRHYTARIMTALAAVPLITVISVSSSLAFTDMNDSAAQADVVKSLQKRIDSLEVRFEKEEVARNDAKKTALDWNRGIFMSSEVGIQNFPSSINIRAGYLIGRKHKDGTKHTISPILQLGPIYRPSQFYDLTDSTQPSSAYLEVGFGIQKSTRIFDKVSTTTGWYLHTLPSIENDGPKLWAIGGGVDYSIDFWLNEQNAVGFGYDMALIMGRRSDMSWVKILSPETSISTYAVNFINNLHVHYTFYFANHNGKSRK